MAVNAYYERAYTTTGGIVNVPALFEGWLRDSEAARNALTCHVGVPYGTANRETVDLFIAQGSSRWVIFIHGGYWRRMTAGHFSYLAPPLVAGGWNVAMLEYDLCPAVTLATITEQCRQGFSWLCKHAADYSSGCDELVISGHSAGGHLTAMMLATDWAARGVNANVIKGGIAISGLFDLEPLTHTAINTDLRLTHNDVVALSPPRLAPHLNVPLVVAVGELESSEFHRQCALLKGAPGWDAIATDAVVIPGANHFAVLDDFMNLDGAMWGRLSR